MQKVSFGPIWDEIQKVRDKEGIVSAISLANQYIAQNPLAVEPYLQLMDMYYISGDLSKAEKPVDFLLKKALDHPLVKKDVLYYIKALILSEKTQWSEAKEYIKKALKLFPDNPEYKRLLAVIEYWSGNKSKAYNMIQDLIDSNNLVDAELLLDAVLIAIDLGFDDDARKYIDLFFSIKDKINYFTKPKSYYVKKFSDFKLVLDKDLSNENS